MEPAENGKALIESIKRSNKVDFVLSAHMNSAIAIFGDLYAKNKDRISKLSKEDQLKEIKKLGMESAELSPVAGMSGATKLVQAYIGNLIERSEKLDAKNGNEKGTGLRQWAAAVSKATHEKLTDDKGNEIFIDFTKIYGNQATPLSMQAELSKIGGNNVRKIRDAIRESASQNISADFKKNDIEHDLIAQLNADADDKKEKKEFDKVTADTPKPMGGMFMLILAFVGMLMGLDMGGLLKGTQSVDAAQKEVAKEGGKAAIAAVTPELQKTIDNLASAAIELGEFSASPKNVLAGKLKWLAEFTDVEQGLLEKLPPAHAGRVAEAITKNIYRMRNGEISGDDAKQNIKAALVPTSEEINQYVGGMKQVGEALFPLATSLVSGFIPPALGGRRPQPGVPEVRGH